MRVLNMGCGSSADAANRVSYSFTCGVTTLSDGIRFACILGVTTIRVSVI